jgi:hypothetical protein
LSWLHKLGRKGVEKTLHCLCRNFHAPGVCRLIQDHVRTCSTCQRNKSEHLHPAGLLQPLDILSTVWLDITVDFVEGFLHVNGKFIVLMVVDRFSKAAYHTAGTPLHGYDGGPAFLRYSGAASQDSKLRGERPGPGLHEQLLEGVVHARQHQALLILCISPQSCGQSEATNKTIMMYLRCLVGDRP